MLDAANAGKLPLSVMGWGADYPDPHNFAFNFMHSKGSFSSVLKYANAKADELVEAAVAAANIVKRKELYARLQALEFEDVPHFVVVDSVRFRAQRSWVKGWKFGPVDPDAPYGGFFRELSKTE